MALFGSFGKKTVAGPAQDPKWARSSSGHFRRFVNLDPEAEGLTNKSGVFVIWHGGLRPRWVYVGSSSNMARALHDVSDDNEVMGYEVNGGLFVTWATIRDEYQAGVVKYLNDTMTPLVENPGALVVKDAAVPVIFPGKEKK